MEQQFASQQEGGPEAVSIVWSNRNTLSGAGDNFFDDVFGTSRPAAQAVVDAALAAWSRVITSFNRADATSTLQVNITMNRDANNNFVGGFGGAGGPANTAPADGKPRTGSITVNAGNLSADPNDSNGWFLDSTPNDYSEFQGDILTPFAANRTTNIGSDLFSLITAEVTHTLGLISAKPGSTDFEGYLLANSGFVQATGVRDNAEGGGTSGFFYTFDGPTIDHLMTSYNSGDGDSDSWGNVIHTAGGTANISFGGKTWRGTEDDGNAAYTVERMLPSHVTATILKDAYGYSIEPPAKFGSMYSVLDSVSGVLNVRGAENSSDTISITRSGSLLTVAVDIQQDVPGSHNASGASNAPAWTTEYNLAQISQINVFPRSGDDAVLVSADMGNIPVLVNGDVGSDKLQVFGGAGYDSFATPAHGSLATTNGSIAYSGVETLEIFTGDGNADVDLPFTFFTSARVTGGPSGQTINFARLDGGTPTVIDLGNGNDVLNFATGAGVAPVKSAVTIFGVGGDDTFNIAPADFASTVITQPVAVFGDAGNDTMLVGSNNADSVDVNLTFDGGVSSGVTGDRIVYNDTAPSYNVSYDIGATVITRDGANLPRSITYSNLEGIVVNCGSGADSVIVRNGVAPIVTANGNGGNDNFTRGDGNVTATSGAIFNGGSGIDRITFDDHLRPGNLIWDMHDNEVIYGGLILFETTGFESVGILAGNGNDEITFGGNLTQSFNVDGGGGDDTFIVGFLNKAQFQAPVTMTGGAGNDNYNWTRGSNNWYQGLVDVFLYDVLLDGGTGFNTLAADETTRTAAGYNLYPDRFYATDGAVFPVGFDVDYDNMQAMSLTAGSGTTNVAVYGTSSDINPGNQISIAMGGGSDNLYLYPHDAQGNLTINGNLGVGGGAGTDSLFVIDSASPAPAAYAFANPFGAGTQNITGVGSAGFGIGSDFEAITMTGSAGNDVYNVNSYKSGMGLTINGGAGDDECNFGNNDVAANVTSIASFLFNGEGGTDTFNLRNATPANSFTYTAAANTTLQVSRTLPSSYFVSLEYYNTEHKVVYAGPAVDVMNITSFASGELSFHGAGGDDALNLPTSSDLLGRRVNFYGEAGTANRINQVTNSKAAPSTLHVAENTIGAFPGDTFFAPGGSVFFDSVQVIQLRMGSGADTAYLRPNAVAAISVVGGSPSTAPGDTLNLALAAAADYLVNGSPASGSVTSSNLKPLSYSGFETGPTIDDVAPAVENADININGAPAFADGNLRRQSIDVQFSEDTSALISPGSLTLMNLTTNETIPPTNIAVEYDPATDTARFTFPGYADGVLPDGDYEGRVLAGLPDLFGNGLSADAPFTFFFLQGDANHDRHVNLADFNILAANFGTAGGAVFSQADFNYDGNVNLQDFNVLAARFGSALGGGSGAGVTPAIDGVRGGRIIDDLRERLM